MMKTFLRRPGNKSKVLKYILPHIPKEYNTYYEPFVGSGSLFLKLEPKKWVINDLNKDIYKIWKYVQKDSTPFINYFKNFENKVENYSHEEKLGYCRKLTDSLNSIPYNLNRAIVYLLLINIVYGNIIIKNKYYFTGFYYNEKYNFGKNIGKFRLTTDIFINNISNVSNLLKRKESRNNRGKIYNKDYKVILDKTQKDDFVYLDPPYLEEKIYQFNYNREENIDSTFIDQLLIECQKLDKKEVKWLMSQADTLEIRHKFKDYKIIKYKIFRFFLKDYKTELLIKNYQ